MRITIDLPDELHARVVAIARETHQSLSETVASLIRRGLGSGPPSGEVVTSEPTGLPVVHLGRTITTEDLRLERGDTTL
jgi:hypothetical protein